MRLSYGRRIYTAQDAPHFITRGSFLSLCLAQRICADAETKANEKISSYEEQLSSLRERSQKILMDKDRFIQFTRQTFILDHCFYPIKGKVKRF